MPELILHEYAESGNCYKMDKHLNKRSFFVGRTLSLADIALYAYSHVADEGGFMLADYPHIGAWLDRVAAMPGHVAMTA